MISAAELDLAGQARGDLERIKELLIAPSLASLLEATPILEQSAETLARLERRVREPGETEHGTRQRLRQEVQGLRQTLRGVTRLLSSAAAFHTGVAGLMGAADTAYSRTGELCRPGGELRYMVVRG